MKFVNLPDAADKVKAKLEFEHAPTHGQVTELLTMLHAIGLVEFDTPPAWAPKPQLEPAKVAEAPAPAAAADTTTAAIA